MLTQHENFETLLSAARSGRLALVECRDSRTGEIVECLCATNQDEDGSVASLSLGCTHSKI